MAKWRLPIRFGTDAGDVTYDFRRACWLGPAELVDKIVTYPKMCHQVDTARVCRPDPFNPEWVYLHGFWALANAGVLFAVLDRPQFGPPPRNGVAV